MASDSSEVMELLQSIPPTDISMLRYRGDSKAIAPDFELPLDATVNYYEGLSRAEAKAKKKGEIWRVLGDCYVMGKDFDKALDAYTRAMCLLPRPTRHLKLWYGVGIIYQCCGYLDHAEAIFTYAQRCYLWDDDTASQIYHRLAILCMQRGQYQKSMQHLERIFSTSPLLPSKIGALLHIGDIYQRQHDYARALDAYGCAVRAGPTDKRALRQLGWHYHQRMDGDFGGIARDYLLRAVDEDLSDPQSWYLLGNAYARAGEHEKALLAYWEAVKYGRDNVEFWCSIGEVYLDTRQYIRAIETYRHVIQVNPGIGEAWIKLGMLYIMTGQILEAINAYEKASGLHPRGHDVDIAHNLSRLKSIQASGEGLSPGAVDLQELRRVSIWAETTLHSPTSPPGPPQILHGHRKIQHPLSMVPLPWQCSLLQVASSGATYDAAGAVQVAKVQFEGLSTDDGATDLVTAWPKREGRPATAADIPPELFEVIIHSTPDEVHGAIFGDSGGLGQSCAMTLCTFSLVARSWARFARPLIWGGKTLTIWTIDEAREVQRISLTGSQRMPRVVDMIEQIEAAQWYDDEPWLHHLANFDPVIKQKCKKLELCGPIPDALAHRTSLSSPLWGSMYHIGQARFILRHITEVELCNIHFTRFQHLVQLIRHFPHVTTLSISQVTWDETGAEMPQAVHTKRCTLKVNIEVRGCTDNSFLFMALHGVYSQLPLHNVPASERIYLAKFLQKRCGKNYIELPSYGLSPLREEIKCDNEVIEIACSPYTLQTASHVTGILVTHPSEESYSMYQVLAFDAIQDLVELANRLSLLHFLAIHKYLNLDKHKVVSLQNNFVGPQGLRDGVTTRLFTPMPIHPTLIHLMPNHYYRQYISLNLISGETWKSTADFRNEDKRRTIIPYLLGNIENSDWEPIAREDIWPDWSEDDTPT
ncbi:TPR-like protein [Trametopsis cervina]|nr:TPR-like protein [Trametopsis cervina]